MELIHRAQVKAALGIKQSGILIKSNLWPPSNAALMALLALVLDLPISSLVEDPI